MIYAAQIGQTFAVSTESMGEAIARAAVQRALSDDASPFVVKGEIIYQTPTFSLDVSPDLI